MTATAPRVVAVGRRVRLREKQEEDAPRDYEWRRDIELAAYDATRPITMSYKTFVKTMSEELRRPSKYRRTYAIEEIDGGTHIGNVMYYGYDSLLREAELGITIGVRAYWGQGYGTDAVRTLLELAFEELELRRMYLHTLTSNARAQRAFEKAGFRRTRQVRRDGYQFERMEILREELAVLLAAERDGTAAERAHERRRTKPAAARFLAHARGGPGLRGDRRGDRSVRARGARGRGSECGDAPGRRAAVAVASREAGVGRAARYRFVLRYNARRIVRGIGPCYIPARSGPAVAYARIAHAEARSWAASAAGRLDGC